MIKIALTMMIVFISTIAYSQIQKEVVSLVTEERDTLYLADNVIGHKILEVWDEHYPITGFTTTTDRPKIIIMSEEWIALETVRRKDNYDILDE
jgi:hypothetical protein